jgi:hypothetical protein
MVSSRSPSPRDDARLPVALRGAPAAFRHLHCGICHTSVSRGRQHSPGPCGTSSWVSQPMSPSASTCAACARAPRTLHLVRAHPTTPAQAKRWVAILWCPFRLHLQPRRPHTRLRLLHRSTRRRLLPTRQRIPHPLLRLTHQLHHQRILTLPCRRRLLLRYHRFLRRHPPSLPRRSLPSQTHPAHLQ